MATVRLFSQFISGSIRQVLRGHALYWSWLAFLLLLGITLFCWAAFEVPMAIASMAAVGLPRSLSMTLLVLLAVNLGLVAQGR